MFIFDRARCCREIGHGDQDVVKLSGVPCRGQVAEDTGRWRGPALLLCQGGALFQCVDDGAGEQSFEAADDYVACFAFGVFALEVGAGGGVVAGVSDCNPVERAVELSVAAAVEPVALEAA